MSGYVKNTWVDQNVERPKTYEVTNNADGSITLTDSFGLVTELGTPVNADNMNHIEDGLTRVSITEYDNTFTYSEDDWVTGVVDGEKTICRSKTDNNTGNALSNDTYWEVLKLGGSGSGYQMFDIVMKDHILSYEESLGFAPLGTYVYKEAIAGTRYGYPDFYADVVAEYQDVNNTTDTVDSTTVTINANGHKFYDIADKATFDNMYAITGEAWYYGIDTTNERIFLPRSTRFKNGTSVDVGGYQAAGLPNITGQVGYYSRNTEMATTGSLYLVDQQYVGNGGGGGGQYVAGVGIDASLSSSIYGASNTVEYSSTKLIPYMVVGNQSTWSGMTDVVNQGMTILSQVNAGLATKLDLDLTNITNLTKSTIAGYAMPSGTHEDLVLGASGTTYTAPVDGYYLFDKEGLNGGEYALITTSRNAQTITQFEGSIPATYFHLCWLIPVAKGDVLYTQYTLSGVTTYFRFIYAQGSESEAN
jgi:hypothetical protein